MSPLPAHTLDDLAAYGGDEGTGALAVPDDDTEDDEDAVYERDGLPMPPVGSP